MLSFPLPPLTIEIEGDIAARDTTAIANGGRLAARWGIHAAEMGQVRP